MDNTDLNDKEVWTVLDVAKYLGITRSGVHTKLREGRIRGWKGRVEREGRGPKRIWLFDPEHIKNLPPPNKRRGAMAGKRWGIKIPLDQHPHIIDSYVDGMSLQEIANMYGVSRERIRQIVEQIDPQMAAERAARRQELRMEKADKALTVEMLSRMQNALDNDIRCVTCGGWVIRYRNYDPDREYTCSRECSAAWKHLRTFDEWEKHRRQQALATLNSQRRARRSEIALAKEILAGTAAPANRRYFVPGSERAEVIRKYRPEEFKRIVEALDEDSRNRKEFGI